ncbi:hypothetical protein C5167_021598 [Papaver somniferum]|uniref:uncharacterized protein LOC113340674 isoform X2 n=1 Tax=Papaver somniferum TaxID=3469 RepID=UPI000E6F94EB|nr:uncharacterized protein LOC113340674 isoform X2 [Papaver somniferum]RZC91885.1 hypothetical protein C5167_021598 [Papaver somniferum]
MQWKPIPDNQKVLCWISVLTCSDENFIAKSGAQCVASCKSVALIALDTSPILVLGYRIFLGRYEATEKKTAIRSIALQTQRSNQLVMMWW